MPPAKASEFGAIGNVNDEGGVQRYRANRKATIPAIFHVAAWMAVFTMIGAWLFVAIDTAAYFKRRSDLKNEEEALMKKMREDVRQIR